MPDRVIRDELLTSERYWRCSPEARCLYISILLSVDDAARFTGAPFALRTRCMAGTVSHERIESILTELVDVDLVRRYESDGMPYLFVPRFRNRRRYVASSKYPAPPIEINDVVEKKADSGRTQDNPKSSSSRTQDERGRRGVGVKHAATAALKVDSKKAIFDLGIQILTAFGSGESSARSFLAKQIKEGHGGEAKLAEVLGYLAANPKVEPKAYIVAAMKPQTQEERMAEALQHFP